MVVLGVEEKGFLMRELKAYVAWILFIWGAINTAWQAKDIIYEAEDAREKSWALNAKNPDGSRPWNLDSTKNYLLRNSVSALMFYLWWKWK